MDGQIVQNPAIRREILDYLDTLGFFGWRLGLDRIKALSHYFDEPHTKYPSIHIAGTNGKGSTAAMLAAIGVAAGLRVGLYTSPHLYDPTERIQINGAKIDGREFKETLSKCRMLVDKLQATYFEVFTIIALTIFAEHKVDLAIIETGLGGRLDATNIINPEISIITSIGREHQQYLGKTLSKITEEKAGIIKRSRLCLSSVEQSHCKKILINRCRELGAAFWDARSDARISHIRYSDTDTRFNMKSRKLALSMNDLSINLLGKGQVRNAVSAIMAAKLLNQRGFNLRNAAIQNGLMQVNWPARIQIINRQPTIIVDAAHNLDSMRELVKTVKQLFSYHKLRIVMALMQDKPAVPILKLWRDLQPEFFFASTSNGRSLLSTKLFEHAKKLDYSGFCFDSPAAAFWGARNQSHKDDLLIVAGSHYLIGELIADAVILL